MIVIVSIFSIIITVIANTIIIKEGEDVFFNIITIIDFIIVIGIIVIIINIIVITTVVINMIFITVIISLQLSILLLVNTHAFLSACMHSVCISCESVCMYVQYAHM